ERGTGIRDRRTRGGEGRRRALHRGGGDPGPRGEAEEAIVKVRQASPGGLPELVRMFQELDRMQREWRVFTPRPGFYDEVADKYRQALERSDALVAVAEEDGEVVGMAYAEVRVPSRFSDERALEISGVVVRSGHRGRGVGRAL